MADIVAMVDSIMAVLDVHFTEDDYAYALIPNL
jgi:hypothetical protein